MADHSVIQNAIAHSRLKIEWAKQHINAVESLVNIVIAENKNPISIKTNTETGRAVVLIGPKQGIPAQLPLHLGDAIHALNSATDFLWSGLARTIDTKSANARITFPRHETRENLEADLSRAKGKYAAIRQAFPQAKAFILDVVKPYKRTDGNPSYIWHLGKIDNINKHRLLITTPYIVAFKHGLTLQGSDGGTIILRPQAGVKTQGHPMTIGLTPPVKIQNDPEPTVSVIFDEPDHFAGQPVVETLVYLTEATTEVVNAFEKTFL